LNELVNSWGVDNIHLLLSRFKDQYRELVTSVKSLKNLNN